MNFMKRVSVPLRRRAGGSAVAMLLAVIALAAAGCRGEGPEEEKTAAPSLPVEAVVGGEELPEGVVAVVNGQPITVEQFAGDLSAAVFLAKAATFEGRMDVLNGRIDGMLMVEKARVQGYEQRPMIRRMIERRLRRLTMGEVVRALRPDPQAVSEAEIEAAVGPQGDVLDATVILSDTRDDAVAARARVLGGEEMEAVARDVSVSPGVFAKGSRRLLQEGRTMYPPEVEEAVFALPTGEVGEPMKTPVGYLVVRVEERRPIPEEELEKMRAEAREELLAELYQEALDDLLAERREGLREKVILDDITAISLPDIAGNPAAVWRALEAIEMAEAQGVLLTLGDLFRDVGDYNNFLESKRESWQKIYERVRRRQVSEVLMYRYGEERGLDKKPSVSKALEQYADQVLVAQFGADVILGVLEKEPSREQVESFFLEHRDRYLSSPRLALAQIVIRRREAADSVMDALRAGGDFASLAREHSVHVSAADGGVLGPAKGKDLEPEFGEGGVQELLGMARAGRLGPVMLRTTRGFHIVLVLGFQEVGEGSLGDVREDIMPDLLKYRQTEAVKEVRVALRDAADIRIDEEKVRTVAPLPGGAPGASGPHQGRRSSPGGPSPHSGKMPSAPGRSPH